MLSTIKDRVLEIIVSKGIEREKFFSELGVSYSNFRGRQKNSALSSDVIAKILSLYTDINPTWLLTGEGPMLKTMVERKLLEQILPDEILTQKNNQPKMEAQEVLIEQMRSEIEHLRNELLSWKDECQKKNETINNLLSMVTGNQVTKKKEAS